MNIDSLRSYRILKYIEFLRSEIKPREIEWTEVLTNFYYNLSVINPWKKKKEQSLAHSNNQSRLLGILQRVNVCVGNSDGNREKVNRVFRINSALFHPEKNKDLMKNSVAISLEGCLPQKIH